MMVKAISISLTACGLSELRDEMPVFLRLGLMVDIEDLLLDQNTLKVGFRTKFNDARIDGSC